MRERLFDVVRRLVELGWRDESPLVKVLRHIAEEEDRSTIEDIFEAFR